MSSCSLFSFVYVDPCHKPKDRVFRIFDEANRARAMLSTSYLVKSLRMRNENVDFITQKYCRVSLVMSVHSRIRVSDTKLHEHTHDCINVESPRREVYIPEKIMNSRPLRGLDSTIFQEWMLTRFL